jgi:hypothetical protein
LEARKRGSKEESSKVRRARNHEAGSDEEAKINVEFPGSILESYPYLEKHDIQEALNYAAFLADDQIIEL